MNEMLRVSRKEVEDFLYYESSLIDNARFEEWLGLFTPDARYRLPISMDDNELEPALIDDDRERLEERIYRLTSTEVHAQQPPSKTIHAVTNVRVESQGDADLLVRCNLTVHEVRIGGPGQVGLGELRVLPGRAEYVLALGTPLRIRKKTVYLLERELPMQNIAFII